jgi:hypothetical protein
VAEEPQKQSAAATAAEKVRAIVEAAERSAAELEDAARAEAARIRADAERDADVRLGDARLVASRLADRAAELERQVAALRASIAALDADLQELRGVTPPAPAPAAAEVEPVAGPLAAGEPDEVDETIAEAEAAAARGPEVGEAAPDPDVGAPEPAAAEPERAGGAEAVPAGGAADGARVIALNMALGGTPREQTARYLAENFELEDPDALLDDVYSRAGG